MSKMTYRSNDRQKDRQTYKRNNMHKTLYTDYMCLTMLLVQLIHCWRNLYWLLCTRVQKLGRDNSGSMAV